MLSFLLALELGRLALRLAKFAVIAIIVAAVLLHLGGGIPHLTVSTPPAPNP